MVVFIHKGDRVESVFIQKVTPFTVNDSSGRGGGGFEQSFIFSLWGLLSSSGLSRQPVDTIAPTSSAMQSQKAVSVYFTSEQIPPFGSARQKPQPAVWPPGERGTLRAHCLHSRTDVNGCGPCALSLAHWGFHPLGMKSSVCQWNQWSHWHTDFPITVRISPPWGGGGIISVKVKSAKSLTSWFTITVRISLPWDEILTGEITWWSHRQLKISFTPMGINLEIPVMIVWRDANTPICPDP